MAPKKEQMMHVLGMDYQTFCRNVHPFLRYLANNMDEVHWDDRLHPMNHCDIWPYYVTHIKDTYCVPVADSSLAGDSSLLYSTKYHTTGLKAEVTCDFRGHIVDFKFPAGTANASDFTIHNQRVADGEIVLHPWELGMGDGAYRGCTQLLAKYPENFNYAYDRATRYRSIVVPLTDEQELLNAMVFNPRQRIEHTVGQVSYHALCRTKYRGAYEPLCDAAHITMHLTNMKIRMCSVDATDANGRSRYADVCGPWRHDLPDVHAV